VVQLKVVSTSFEPKNNEKARAKNTNEIQVTCLQDSDELVGTSCVV